MNRLREEYKEKISKKLLEDLKLSSPMQLPRLKKVVVNAGIGDIRESKEAVSSFVEELTAITGQKPYPRKARLSEAGFKIRKNDVVGYAVTLRGEKMWAFVDKLNNIVFPRVRDFKGVSLKSFDAHGNYSLGLKDHTIFPEIDPNKVKGAHGLQVTMCVDAENVEHCKELLKLLGVPFKKD